MAPGAQGLGLPYDAAIYGKAGKYYIYYEFGQIIFYIGINTFWDKSRAGANDKQVAQHSIVRRVVVWHHIMNLDKYVLK